MSAMIKNDACPVGAFGTMTMEITVTRNQKEKSNELGDALFHRN